MVAGSFRFESSAHAEASGSKHLLAYDTAVWIASNRHGVHAPFGIRPKLRTNRAVTTKRLAHCEHAIGSGFKLDGGGDCGWRSTRKPVSGTCYAWTSGILGRIPNKAWRCRRGDSSRFSAHNMYGQQRRRQFTRVLGKGPLSDSHNIPFRSWGSSGSLCESSREWRGRGCSRS